MSQEVLSGNYVELNEKVLLKSLWKNFADAMTKFKDKPLITQRECSKHEDLNKKFN